MLVLDDRATRLPELVDYLLAPAQSGSVDIDGTRDGALRALTLTVSPDGEPSTGSRPPAPRSRSPGLILDDGTEELVPLDVFVLHADLEESEDGAITVGAGDRSRQPPFVRLVGEDASAARTQGYHLGRDSHHTDRWADGAWRSPDRGSRII